MTSDEINSVYTRSKLPTTHEGTKRSKSKRRLPPNGQKQSESSFQSKPNKITIKDHSKSPKYSRKVVTSAHSSATKSKPVSKVETGNLEANYQTFNAN
jgi:hypothetical protein